MSEEMDFSHTRSGLSLILPAFNEAAVIEQAITEASRSLAALRDNYEIIVVDDGSSDATTTIVEAVIKQDPHVHLIRHPVNMGYGASLRTGFASANMPLVAFTDADCQFNLDELDRYLLLARSYDIVCGYRIDRKDSKLRCCYSRGYNLIARSLLGITVRDIDCALKLFHRRVVQNLRIESNGFLVNSELLTQARENGYSVVEVGVTHRPRAAGQSTVSIRHIPAVLSGLLRYWWNRVHFPGEADSQRTCQADSQRTGADAQIAIEKPSSQRMGSGRTGSWPAIALLCVAALFVLTNLGYPLIDRDETRYAEIPREMLISGDWILPQLNFLPYYDKPPLLYWSCALSYRILGVHEWAARLVPALAALATLAATLGFGSRWFGCRAGLWSGIALSITVGFLFCSRYLLIDGLFTALVTLSWMLAYESFRSSRFRRGWWYASAAFGGLAILAKGPLAWALWLPPLASYVWLTDLQEKPKPRDFAGWLAASALVASPWFAMVAARDPHFLTEFLLTHHLQRFAGAFHEKPLWYFVPVLLLAGHPWSSLTVPLGRFLFSRNREAARRRPRAIGFLMLWSVWCFTFFTLSKCKLPTYVLPMAPAIALIVGVYMDRILSDSTEQSDFLARNWSPRLATAISVSAAIAFLCFEWLTDSSSSNLVIGWSVMWGIVVLLAYAAMRKSRSAGTAWTATVLTTALLGFMVMHQLLPNFSRSRSLLAEDAALRTRIASADQVVTIDHEFSEVPFYLNRTNMEHWHRIDKATLSRCLDHRSRAILVLPDGVPPSSLRDQLPAHARLRRVANRETGNVFEVQIPTTDSVPSIATAPDPVTH